MDQKQEQKKMLVEYAVKFVLALALLFPVYALLYITFPASIVAFYLISAVICVLFLPWDDLRDKFLS